MEEVVVGRRNRQTDVASRVVVWQYFKTGRSQKFTFVVDWELCIGHALCIWSVILDTAVSFIGVRRFIHRMLVLSGYIICCFFFVWLRISCQWIDSWHEILHSGQSSSHMSFRILGTIPQMVGLKTKTFWPLWDIESVWLQNVVNEANCSVMWTNDHETGWPCCPI